MLFASEPCERGHEMAYLNRKGMRASPVPYMQHDSAGLTRLVVVRMILTLSGKVKNHARVPTMCGPESACIRVEGTEPVIS